MGLAYDGVQVEDTLHNATQLPKGCRLPSVTCSQPPLIGSLSGKSLQPFLPPAAVLPRSISSRPVDVL